MRIVTSLWGCDITWQGATSHGVCDVIVGVCDMILGMLRHLGVVTSLGVCDIILGVRDVILGV